MIRALCVLASAIALLYLTQGALSWICPGEALSGRLPLSSELVSRKGELLRLTSAADGRYRRWTPLAEIAPAMREAALLYEDRAFYYHPGVNPLALLRALHSTYLRPGGRRIGASTITMQLARRLYRIPSHTLGGKLQQLARALYLEARYDKDAILEAYLNLVPQGGNIEGVGAAARIYFGKSAKELSLGEAAMLAVIPQNPAKRSPGRRLSGGVTSAGRRVLSITAPLEAARQRLLSRWLDRHPEETKAIARARLPLAVRSRQSLPFRAPHAVDRALQRWRRRPVAGRSVASAQQSVATTVDLELHDLAAPILRDYIAARRGRGIDNAAAMLLDHRSQEVLLAIGSANYHDSAISGQVDGTTARRSAASTLKPFVYALALEQGLIHEKSMVRDLPLAFGHYQPRNFDGRFSGPLSAAEALTKSRNVPAVELAAGLREPGFADWLRGAGLLRHESPRRHGLGLALGTLELSMSELAGLYAALANGGVLRPLRRLRHEPLAAGQRVLSPQATFVALQMLRHHRPGALPEAVAEAPQVAWKTGTSNGNRDAWTVGVFGPYVLAVWVGDFSGQGNPALVGRRAAAPLFFRLVDAIAAKRGISSKDQRRPPKGVKRLSVCSLTGHLPGEACPQRKQSWFIPGRSPIVRCTVHRRITVDRRSKKRSCRPVPRAHRETRVVEQWSSEMHRLFAAAGLPRRRLPPHDGSCGLEVAADHGAAPRILAPLEGVTYLKERTQQRISLEADLAADARWCHWFADRKPLGRVAAGKTLRWSPRLGRTTLRVIDSAGRSASRVIEVRAPVVAHR